MCGILGLLDVHEPVGVPLYRGAQALQHRGQDGAGLTTFDARFYHHTGLGLLADVFRNSDLEGFRGHMGLAHLRYGTAGVGAVDECQPFLVSFPFGLALVHNGNLTNEGELRGRLAASGYRHVNSQSDSETLLHIFADALSREDLSALTVDAVMRGAKRTMEALDGSYSVILMIANYGLLAFRDPQGLRPLAMGHREGAVAFASESLALDTVDVPLERDVRPGEAIFVDMSGEVHAEQLLAPTPAHCSFEYIYLARPESVIDGRSVSEVRERLGISLAERLAPSEDPEVAFDVPTSAEDAAVAFAREAGIPYRKGIRRNAYSHRSFIAANPALRRGTVGVKFHFERRVIDGKRIAVIDDSIVRGTTARALIERLRRQGARRVTFLSASPPVAHPCPYGIDMAVRQDLLASSMDAERIREYLGVDHLQYQTVEDLDRAMDGLSTCKACFTGCYPTRVNDLMLARYERERISATGPLVAPAVLEDARVGTRPR